MKPTDINKAIEVKGIPEMDRQKVLSNYKGVAYCYFVLVTLFILTCAHISGHISVTHASRKRSCSQIDQGLCLYIHVYFVLPFIDFFSYFATFVGMRHLIHMHLR